MLSKLPHWIYTDLRPAFYETESLTAVEMVARLYKHIQEHTDKLNEYCHDVDTFVADYKEFMEKDIEAFKIAIEQKHEDFTEVLNTRYESLELLCKDIAYIIKDLNEGGGE